MSERGTDPAYLEYQYSKPEKLRIRQETHARFSDKPGDGFLGWVESHLAVESGDVVLDAASGPGIYHQFLQRDDVRVLAIDYSLGMVRAVLSSASQRGLTVQACRARLESLPLPDASCDRVMANHVLYHVRDIKAAILELRRTLKPGGRVVIATGASDCLEELESLHASAARKLAYEPSDSILARFTLDDRELVRQVFPSARVFEFEDAFRFPSTEAALRYYATGLVDHIENAPRDGGHRQPLMSEMGQSIREIIDRDGEFVVPKTSGVFVAEK